MSRARKLKKAAREVTLRYLCHDNVTWKTEVVSGPSVIRHSVNYEKRRQRDPFFLVSQSKTAAPVKYSRCPHCVEHPHHSPWLDGVWS